MFCLKCGEAIPDDSRSCPKCGAAIRESVDHEELAVVYASQKTIDEEINPTPVTVPEDRKIFFLWSAIAVVSLILMKMSYFSVSISLYFAGSSDSNYTGYGLLECLEGSVRISAMMCIGLIIVNIAVILTGIIAYKGSIKNSVLKRLMIIESIVYLIVTIVPYFDISNVLKEFDSSLSNTAIGAGCYFNIAIGVLAVILYIAAFNKKLEDK